MEANRKGKMLNINNKSEAKSYKIVLLDGDGCAGAPVENRRVKDR